MQMIDAMRLETINNSLNGKLHHYRYFKHRLMVQILDRFISSKPKNHNTSSNYKNFIRISLFTIQQNSEEKKNSGWVALLIQFYMGAKQNTVEIQVVFFQAFHFQATDLHF